MRHRRLIFYARNVFASLSTKPAPTREWMGPHITPPVAPRSKGHITIKVNQFAIENNPDKNKRLDDYGRTYTITHEIGHVLGLAHPDASYEEAGCGIDRSKIESVMEKGTDKENPNRKPFDKPQEYDKVALQTLYGSS